MTSPISYNFSFKFSIHWSTFDCICVRVSKLSIIMIFISFLFHVVMHSSWLKLKTGLIASKICFSFSKNLCSLLWTFLHEFLTMIYKWLFPQTTQVSFLCWSSFSSYLDLTAYKRSLFLNVYSLYISSLVIDQRHLLKIEDLLQSQFLLWWNQPNPFK